MGFGEGTNELLRDYCQPTSNCNFWSFLFFFFFFFFLFFFQGLDHLHHLETLNLYPMGIEVSGGRRGGGGGN